VSERVLVAMSGGVDSSVAAALLVEAGYDVVGATMKLFCYGDSVPDRPCCSLDSITDAQLVAHKLGIPHYVVNLEHRFGRDVIADFVREYARGRAATRSPSSATSCITPTRSTAPTSPRATTPSRAPAPCIAAAIPERTSRTSCGGSTAPWWPGCSRPWAR
jgi:hypothetical protein